MRLADLKTILKSRPCDVQFCVLVDQKAQTPIEDGCSIEYVMENYGNKEVEQINAINDDLIIFVK